jgi:hypothetical protein
MSKPQNRYLWPIHSIAVVLGFGGVSSARADLIFQVVVDTAAVQDVVGSVDFQFNPGGPGSLAATATVTGFSTDGTGLSANTTDGDVSGNLNPGPLAINNTFLLNDLLENITYGTNMAFTLALSGAAVDSSDPSLPGSSFSLSLYDASFNPLLTIDPAGTVLTLNLNPDGSTSIFTFPSDNSGGASVCTVTQESSVPEPASIFMLTPGLIAMTLYSMARRRQGLALPS